MTQATPPSSTNIDIKIRGFGGHVPDRSQQDRLCLRRRLSWVTTIVIRENSPLDPAVITVGPSRGTRYNIIPDEVNLQLTVRAYKEDVRKKLLAGIERVTKGIAGAAGISAELAPIIKVSETEITTATYNDPVLTERLAGVFAKALGQENVMKVAPVMGSEDFGYFSQDQKIPTTLFWLGMMDPLKSQQSKEAVRASSLHSPLFARYRSRPAHLRESMTSAV